MAKRIAWLTDIHLEFATATSADAVVPGIDVTDALGIAEARRYGVAGVSERPEVAEAGLVEALDDNTGD